MSNLTLKKVFSESRDFFVGMFLVPWVWIWGFYIILFATYLIGVGRGIFTGFESFRFSSDFINLIVVWITTFIFLIGNYSLYHFLRYSYPRLRPILFIVSLFVFIVFALIYLPFLIEVIRLE